METLPTRSETMRQERPPRQCRAGQEGGVRCYGLIRQVRSPPSGLKGLDGVSRLFHRAGHELANSEGQPADPARGLGHLRGNANSRRSWRSRRRRPHAPGRNRPARNAALRAPRTIIGLHQTIGRIARELYPRNTLPAVGGSGRSGFRVRGSGVWAPSSSGRRR